MAKDLLAREFEIFAHCSPGDMSEVQYTDLKRTFMAGAAALYGLLMRRASKGSEPTEDDEHLLRDLRDELLAFNAAVKRGEK